jgi:amidase
MRPNRAYGHLRPPAVTQIQEYAARHRMTLTDEQAAEFAPVIAGILQGFDEIDELPEPPVRLAFHDRDPGRAPLPGEDPYNAFIRFCTVRGAEEGPLAGVRAAVKDCIAVAGVPMTNGSRMQPAMIPSEDAIVVERLLAAGATVIGKTNLEDMAMGLGEGSSYGAARNPRDPRFGTGGSSSGSAAAVASGAADIALGADEAGSVRIPAAWSGLVGMKATHGLVPSYGLTYMDHTIDHIGPITPSVESNARVLEVIAGEDERDPQWFRGSAQPGSYTAGLDRGVRGMTFGIVQEALAPIGCTPDVLEAFESACDVLRNAGATVEVVSIPLWSSAWTIESGVLGFGLRAMIDSGGAGYGHMGRINPATMQSAVSQMRTSADDLALMTRLLLIAVEHLREAYLGVHYAKTQNLRLELRRQVDQALSGVDGLLTPTTPTVATELLDRRAGSLEMIDRLAGSAVLNTCALDLSGHPALTVPAGTGLHGLPVGLQIIGRRLSEDALYRVAAVVEDAVSLPAMAAAAAAVS